MNWNEGIDIAVAIAQIAAVGWLVYGALLAASTVFARPDFSRGLDWLSAIGRRSHRYPEDRLRASVIATDRLTRDHVM